MQRGVKAVKVKSGEETEEGTEQKKKKVCRRSSVWSRNRSSSRWRIIREKDQENAEEE